LDGNDKNLLNLAEKTVEDMGNSLDQCKFREALRAAMHLAQEANRYLEVTSPWKQIKEDRTRAATSLWVVIQAINTLKTVLYPYLPFSSKKLHERLGFEDDIEKHGWKFEKVPAGQRLKKPKPLFKKLDEKIVEEELERIKKQSANS